MIFPRLTMARHIENALKRRTLRVAEVGGSQQRFANRKFVREEAKGTEVAGGGRGWSLCFSLLLSWDFG